MVLWILYDKYDGERNTIVTLRGKVFCMKIGREIKQLASFLYL